jgi:ornithine lipid ester-linked acyl 2-hydroxylase
MADVMNTVLGGKISDFGMWLGKKIVWGLDGFYARNSKLGDHEFFDNRDFPWIPDVEAQWHKVRGELDRLLPYTAHLQNFQDLSKDVGRHISQDDGWKTFFFYAFGLKFWGNCRRCPETTKLVKSIPGMKTAMLSILAPGKHLPTHRGPYKGVLRLHLALLIPKPTDLCAIRVNSDLRHWEEGKVLIFDDCFPHEAWNKTDSIRVVLFLDITRPMHFPANAVNAIMSWAIALSPFVLGSFGSYFRWERRFEKIMNEGKAPQ